MPPMMDRFQSTPLSWVAMLGTVLVNLTALSAEPANKQAPLIQVLLISGDDVSPAHNWREISEATREVLVNSHKMNVRVCEDPLILESASALENYDVIVLTMFNANLPTITDRAKENLVDFVKGGKGIVVQHLASASFKEWPAFRDMCGRYWVRGTSGHGPRSEFAVRIVDKQHPITQGVADFKTNDELYANLQGSGEIRVLVEADSDWSKKTEPLAFVRPYGNGRVFLHCFGHDRIAIMQPAVQKIIAQGVEWAARPKDEKN